MNKSKHAARWRSGSKVAILLSLLFSLSSGVALQGCGKMELTDSEYVESAKDYLDKGELRKGVLELKNALQRNPENPEARWLLGQIYIKLERGAEAEKELRKAQELGVSFKSVQAPLGEALLLQAAFKRVLDEIIPSADTSEQNRAAILRMRGDARLGLGELQEGCELYRKSLKLDANHVPTYWGLAKCSYAEDKPSETRELIDKALIIEGGNAETWVMLGDVERLSNNIEAAQEAYSSALKHQPDHIGALFNRAMLHVFAGQPEAVWADVNRMKKLAPDNFQVQFMEAVLHHGEGKTDQALDLLQQVLQSQPDYMPAVLLLAQVQYDRKAYEQAAHALTRYRQQAPDDPGAVKLLAATYIKLDQPGRALRILKPFLERGEADPQILALAGEAYLSENDPSSAEAAFEKASELIPASSALRTKLGLSLLAAGKQAEGVKELEAASALAPGEYRADVTLAYFYLRKGQFDKALAVVAVLEKKLPDSPGTYNLKGMAYMGKKDIAQARKNFEQALALKPELVSAALRLAALDIREKNFAAARGRYQGVLEKDGDSVAAMVGLAELAALEKNEKGYLDWLERAANVSPSALVPRSLMAKYYLRKGRPLKALAIAREAVTGRPDSPQALNLLGWVQLETGEKENALATYTKLTTWAPTSAAARYHLAKAHAAMGNVRESRAALRKALELDPEYVEALTTLSALEARVGNHEEALRLARELQSLAPASPAGLMLEGDALMAGKRHAEAALVYEKALANKAGSRVAVKLHRARLRSGETTMADETLLAWLEAHPRDTIVRAYLAESYLKRGLNQQAIQHNQKLSSLMPNSAIALNNLAALYQREKDPRALATAEKAYQLKPDSPSVADTLGWILVEQGRVDRGLELLAKAAADAPRDPEVQFHLAYTLSEAGQTTRARQQIEQVQKMRLSPGLEQQVRQLLERLP